ncbi:family transcriptional regulator, putative [Babesia ovata]|uniref:Family transcriptional regulator, putative n=1 Tax=Babesia ovata TaxID=189622 RepID=A0A2H6KED2_9APIC|nr:family transcriptional regulator, putative [Babesia ovata]GBE61358.1 family transcriptional regulator, putative [Babesia ovata]
MNLVVAFAVLAYVQMQRIIAVATTTDQNQVNNETTTNRIIIVDEPDYYDIFPTASRRFKVLMGLLDGDGFRYELLEFVTKNMKDIIQSRFDAWVAELKAAEKQEDAGLNGTKVITGRIPPPAVLKNHLGRKDELLSLIDNKIDEFHTALEEAGRTIHIIFENIFKDYTRNLPKKQANMASRVQRKTGDLSRRDPEPVVPVKLPAPDYVVQEIRNENDYIKLRFVMPPFSEDLLSLYKSIQGLNRDMMQDNSALNEVIATWVKEHVGDMEIKQQINCFKVKEGLEALYGTDKMLYIVTSFREHNLVDENVTESAEKCKKISSACLCTIGPLLAAVIAFTMW